MNLPNISRLLEDMVATLPLLEDQAGKLRPMHPSACALEILGSAFVGNDEDKVHGAHWRESPWELAPLVQRGQIPLLSGRVHLNYILAAVALASKDTFGSVGSDGQWDWLAALRWLVLHGIDRYRLWPFLSEDFILKMLGKSVWTPDGLISPLQLCVLLECPEMRRGWPLAGSAEFAEAFETWMRDEGTKRFNLFWLRSRSQLVDPLRSRRGIGRNAEVFSASATSDSPGTAATRATARGRGDFGQAQRASLEYATFGQDYPCLTLNCCSPTAVAGGAWRGLVRPSIEESGVELLEHSIWLSLPALWLPPSVLLLDMEVEPIARQHLNVRVTLDDSLENLRLARDYSGNVAKIILPDRPKSPSPTLGIHFSTSPGQPAGEAPLRVLARVLGLRFWQMTKI